jgi:hypothetical protein
MATDPPPLAARRSDDPTSDLVAQVHKYSRCPDDLGVIDAALDERAGKPADQR